MFGVEAVSPAPEGEPNFQAHLACGERGITHMECLANLDKLVGRGRFRFIGFPLKIRGGTASPIRAGGVLEWVPTVIASSTPAGGRPALDETSPYRPSPYRHGR